MTGVSDKTKQRRTSAGKKLNSSAYRIEKRQMTKNHLTDDAHHLRNTSETAQNYVSSHNAFYDRHHGVQTEHGRHEIDDLVTRLQQTYTDQEIPNDLTPASFDLGNRTPLDSVDEEFGGFLQVYESSTPPVYMDLEADEDPFADENDREDLPAGRSDTATTSRSEEKKKKVSSIQDKLYRSDREFVKRHSHRKMIWFFRKVGLRHPAAIRTHLEKVKHPEFELPNLQCVIPHPGLTVGMDDIREEDENDQNCCNSKPKRRAGVNSGAWPNRNEANITYYQMYFATEALVERVKGLMGQRQISDKDYNKKVLTFIADIVGRLLWHNNRTHTVMFAKSDHYDRDCFLLYSRQAEQTPFMMRSDKYFCRRHDTEKFKHISPQPDLTRAHSTRVSSESSIYVVGCNPIELWESFPYEYRITNCRQMKSLYDQIRRIDPYVLENTFSYINKYVNGDRNRSPYVEVASRTSFDVLSALLRDADLRDIATDNSVAYKNFIERFATVGILNVHCLLKSRIELLTYGGYRDNDVWQPSPRRLDHIVLHHVNYRQEVRELRTNRVFYYRNANNFICSLSLLDDMFEEELCDLDDLGDRGEKNQDLVYFYDILYPFEYDSVSCVNTLAMQEWKDVTTLIHESAHTIVHRLTNVIRRGPVPQDPFYPSSHMSPTDVAIDSMLERALKHSKKLQILNKQLHGSSPFSRKRERSNETNSYGLPFVPQLDRDVVTKSLSKTGENRLQDGYLSPPRPNLLSDHHVEHNGQQFHVKISTNTEDECGRKMTRVNYGPTPTVFVNRQLLALYVIDPKGETQIDIASGLQILDEEHFKFLKLRTTDRIVRVFTIQAVGSTQYVVNPHVYFVFRNNAVCTINHTLVEEMLEQIKKTEQAFPRASVFKEFNNDLDNIRCISTEPQLIVPDRNDWYTPVDEMKVEGLTASLGPALLDFT